MTRKVKFKGSEYYLTGTYEGSGMLRTPEQQQKGEGMYAYLFSVDGTVRKDSQVIGTVKDLEFLGEEK